MCAVVRRLRHRSRAGVRDRQRPTAEHASARMRPSRFRGDRILPEGKCASGPRGRTAPPRRGAPLVGVLPRSGVGEPRDYKRCISADELRAGAKASADRVLKRARRDEHSDALLATARSDAALGRLTMPRDAAAEPPPDGAVVIPRFGVPQGVKEDGSPKARRTWRLRPSRRPSRGRYGRWTIAAPPTSTERRSPRPPGTRRRGADRRVAARRRSGGTIPSIRFTMSPRRCTRHRAAKMSYCLRQTSMRPFVACRCTRGTATLRGSRSATAIQCSSRNTRLFLSAQAGARTARRRGALLLCQ